MTLSKLDGDVCDILHRNIAEDEDVKLYSKGHNLPKCYKKIYVSTDDDNTE